MAVAFTGTATITTIDGTWTGPAGAAYHKFTDWGLKETRGVNRLKDGAGNTLGFYKETEGEIALDLTVVVRADTLAHSLTGLQIPATNSKVTLASFPDVTMTTGEGHASQTKQINGDWHYRDGVSIQQSAESEVKLTFTVYQYPGCAKTIDALTTTIV